MLFGYGQLVENADEKVWAMTLVTNSVVADRWKETRIPPDNAEMSSTAILKVKIVSGSGKIRSGGPGDEKKDTNRQDVVDRVWTGVLPMWEVVGDPIPGGAGRVRELPGHITNFIEQTKRINEEYARQAAVPEEKVP